MDYGSMIGAFIGGDFLLSPDGCIRDTSGRFVGRFDAKGVSNHYGVRMDCKDIATISFGGGAMELRSVKGDTLLFGDVGGYRITRDFDLVAPQSLIDVVNTMQALYPTIATHLFFEEVSCKEMIDMSMLGRPDLGLIELTDKDVLMLHADFQARMKAAGYKGRLPGKQLTMDAVELLTNPTDGRSRNLFREWLEGLKWDGVPRMKDWFIRTLGVTAPALSSVPEAEAEYIEKVTEAWMIGAVKRQYTSIKHEIVPVFIGLQGAGKGNLLKFMAGDDRWFASTSESISDRKKFMESISGRVIVELGEAVQFRTNDAESLKQFISQEADMYRLSYGRRSSNFVRRFVLVATSNMDTVFTDPTGNRRFFPLYCDDTRISYRVDVDYTLDRRHGQEEVEQLWAEAYHKAMVEERPWYRTGDFTKLSEIMQEYAAVESQAVGVINRYLDDPHNGYTILGSKITREVVLQAVFGVDTNILVPKDIDMAWKEWTVSQNSWSRRTTPGKFNGKSARIFERVRPPIDIATSFLEEYKSRLDAKRIAYAKEEIAVLNSKLSPEMAYMTRMYDIHGWRDDEIDKHIPKSEMLPEEVEAVLDAGLAIRASDGGVITMWCPAYGTDW